MDAGHRVDPIVKAAMNVNGYGLKVRRTQQDLLKFIDNSELLGGIVGSEAEHHACACTR